MMNLKITPDPTGYYTTKEQMNMLPHIYGVLPTWAMADVKRPLSYNLEQCYSFFCGWNEQDKENWAIDDAGHFDYTGDPRLYPAIKLESDEEIIYMYPHAIVGVHDKETGKQKWSRFD